MPSDGSFLTDAPSFVLPGSDAAAQGALTITPASAVVKVTDLTALPTQAFTATLTTAGGTASTVNAIWSVSDYTVATIDNTGTLTPRGNVAATIAVTANYGGLSATTNASITVAIQTQLGDVTLPDGTIIQQGAAGISSTDQTALNGTPAVDGGATVSPLIYPYDQTVFPLGLVAPVVQFKAGIRGAERFQIEPRCDGLPLGRLRSRGRSHDVARDHSAERLGWRARDRDARNDADQQLDGVARHGDEWRCVGPFDDASRRGSRKA